MSESLGLSRSASKAFIIDSWPVMEWLKNREPTVTIFQALLDSADSMGLRLLMSTINLGEVYYNCWNQWGEAEAGAVLDILRKHPIQVVHPTTDDVLIAARIKAIYHCAYADAFTVVLALEYDGAVLTGDPDFLALAHDHVVKVDWIGA